MARAAAALQDWSRRASPLRALPFPALGTHETVCAPHRPLLLELLFAEPELVQRLANLSMVQWPGPADVCYDECSGIEQSEREVWAAMQEAEE